MRTKKNSLLGSIIILPVGGASVSAHDRVTRKQNKAPAAFIPPFSKGGLGGIFSRLSLCLTLPLLLTSCAVGPNFTRPQPPTVTQYTQDPEPTQTITAAGKAQEFDYGDAIAADWWQVFDSPAINEIVKQAVAQNRNLAAAEARLRQSRELLRAGYGVFFPQANFGLGITREKFSPVQFGLGTPGNTFTLYTPQVSAGYTLDVFGGQRRNVEDLAAQVDYQGYTAQATYITLLGNVINTAVAQAAYQAQIDATTEIINIIKEQVKLTETQSTAGTVPYASVVSLQAQLATAEASLPPLQQNLSKTKHLLAALVGRTPGEWTPPGLTLMNINLPRKLPVTLPSELVRRRPDILAAEAQLHSASAKIGVATAALFPNITLSAGIGQNLSDLTKIFGPAGEFWNVGGNLAQPILHGGTLWFQRRAALEAFQVNLAGYQQTVITAFQQVADSLRAVENDAKTLKAQTEALNAATQALQLVKANQEAGLVNYLQVLTADNQYQQARIGVIQAQALRLQDTAALYVALGGGWWAPGTTIAAAH
jgi:NodT family efflux transporter outer membrane factor (OMF) lipoprotein